MWQYPKSPCITKQFANNQAIDNQICDGKSN